jgi:hypothetical protein
MGCKGPGTRAWSSNKYDLRIENCIYNAKPEKHTFIFTFSNQIRNREIKKNVYFSQRRLKMINKIQNTVDNGTVLQTNMEVFFCAKLDFIT